MKLIVTSDTHYGTSIQGDTNCENMIDNIVNENPDIVVLAGDNCDNYHGALDRFFKVLNKIKCKRIVYAGNHCIWSLYPEMPTSTTLWNITLPNRYEKNGWVWGENDIIYHNDIAIIGSIAWYDYSAKSISYPDDYYYINKKKVNNDGSFIKWNKTDREFAKECEEGILDRIRIAHNNNEINKIIIITHIPLFIEQMTSMPNDNRMGDAYFGNLTIGKKILQETNKITHVISGHTHREVNTKIKDINIHVVGSDYGNPKYLKLEV